MATSKKLLIITAPSGAGKTTITRHLLNTFPDQLVFSVSAATRARRENEIDGVHYHFMSVDEFRKKIDKNEFVEWEMVYEGKYYGTLKEELENTWRAGKIPLLDIDVQGAVHVQQQYREISLSIFIEPPSIEELKNRLIKRGSETTESVQTRVSKAGYELTFKPHFDKVVVNDNMDKACLDAETIVRDFLHS